MILGEIGLRQSDFPRLRPLRVSSFELLVYSFFSSPYIFTLSVTNQLV